MEVLRKIKLAEEIPDIPMNFQQRIIKYLFFLVLIIKIVVTFEHRHMLAGVSITLVISGH